MICRMEVNSISWYLVVFTFLQSIVTATADADCIQKIDEDILYPILNRCTPSAILDIEINGPCNCSSPPPKFHLCPPPKPPILKRLPVDVRDDIWQWYDIVELVVIFTAIANVFILVIFFAWHRHKPICHKKKISDDADVAIDAFESIPEAQRMSIPRGKTGKFKHTGSKTAKLAMYINGNNNEDVGNPGAFQETLTNL